jgi:hypothetical protein
MFVAGFDRWPQRDGPLLAEVCLKTCERALSILQQTVHDSRESYPVLFNQSRPLSSKAAMMTSGDKLYTVAHVARPSEALDGKLMVSIGQWYLRFSDLTIAASVTRPRSGSLPVWSAFESSTASTAPRIVRGPGKVGVLDDIPTL